MYLLEVNRLNFFSSQSVRVRPATSASGLDVAIGASLYRVLRSPSELWLAALLNRYLNNRLGRDVCHASAEFEVFSNVFELAAYVTPDDAIRTIGNHVVLITGVGDDELALFDNWCADPAVAPYVPKSVRMDYLRRHGYSYSSMRPAAAVGPSDAPPGSYTARDFSEVSLERIRWLADEVGRGDPAAFIALNTEAAIGTGYYCRSLVDISVDDDFAGMRLVRHLQCVGLVLPNGADVPVIAGWATAPIRDSAATVEDFYVWPPYRLAGVSRPLAFNLALTCRLFGAGDVFFLAHEADIVSRQCGGIPGHLPSWLTKLAWEPTGVRSTPLSARIGVMGLIDRLVQ